MPDISPTLVKELREKTNAGMMDCKRALDETSGDMAKAEELLRKKGIASASKKASRVAKVNSTADDMAGPTAGTKTDLTAGEEQPNNRDVPKDRKTADDADSPG